MPPVGGRQRPGDCNEDGNLDLSDLICLLGFLFLGSPNALPCNSAAAGTTVMDSNNDGAVNRSDAVYKLGFLFQGGPPPEPGTDCILVADCA